MVAGRTLNGLGTVRLRSVGLISASMVGAVAISAAMDVALLFLSPVAPPIGIVAAALLFNATCILMAAVGGLIEWRRPGHLVGRLLMLGGPLYAMLAAGWTVSDALAPRVDPSLYAVINWLGAILSYPGVALIAGWIPLLFPSGSLPGPRWRWPAGILVLLSGAGLLAWAVRPGPLVEGIDTENPFGVAGWPPVLQPFIDVIPLELVALFVLAVAALIARYRRGDPVERLQIRWFLGAVAIIVLGFAGVLVEQAVRTGDDGPLLSVLVAYLGILALPLTIGIAITRYRLYDIDRIISRTIAYGVVTAVLVATFAGVVLTLGTLLSGVTGGETVAVAASTLVAFALFQPLRGRVQHLVDRRFNRARVDAQRAVDHFAARVREDPDLDTVQRRLLTAATSAVHPRAGALWIREER